MKALEQYCTRMLTFQYGNRITPKFDQSMKAVDTRSLTRSGEAVLNDSVL